MLTTKKKYKLKEKKRKGKSTTKESEGSSYFCNKHENDINKVLRNSIYTWDPHKLRPWMTHKQKQPSLETRPNFPSVDFAGKRKGLRVRHQPASKEK